jgi:ferric-dicitrate binding protein FerR (iron transport regulator)
MNDERIEELVQAYLRGEAGLPELEELRKLLEPGDDVSRRVASMLNDGGMIAGWFRAESDERFVDEASAAVKTDRDDPEFVGKTLEKIEQAAARNGMRRRFQRLGGGRGKFPLLPVLAAAGILAAAAVFVVTLPRERKPASGNEAAGKGTPEPEAARLAPPPKDTPEDAKDLEELERLRLERRKQEEDVARLEREKADLIGQQKPEAAREKERAELESKRQLERLAEEERRARGRLREKVSPRETRVGETAPRLLAATVERVQGEAFVSEKQERAGAKPGLAVFSGQEVETAGAKSSVVLRFADGTRLELGADSAVRDLAEMSGDRGKGVFVARGTVTADVVKQPAGAPMTLNTPHAVAAILGTRLTLSVEAGFTRLDVREGRVRFSRQPGGPAVEVPSGFFSVAGPGLEAELRHERAVTLAFQDDVSPMPRYAGTRDCQVGEFKQDADRNYGTGGQVWVDGDCRPPQGDDRYALVRWDLSAIPPGSSVLSVTVSVQVVNDPGGHPYDFYEMKREWVENQATWNHSASKRPWQVPGAKGTLDRGSVILGSLAPRGNGPYTAPFNAAGTAVIQGWVDNPLSNHGFWLGNPDNGDALGFESREAAQPVNRPKLTVTFVPRGR